MRSEERSIKSARDRKSGKILSASEVFKSQADGFDLRNRYASGEIEPECLECHQQLSVPNSKNDNLFFRHFPHSDYCILKEENDIDITRGYYESFHARESDRHKELKNRIGKGLFHVEGVDRASINIDTKFILRGKEKRRPDAYCKFKNVEVVFEIQLSSLPLKYIKHRHEFYKKHGIFLVWVFDSKDPRLLSNMQRDIKYLNSYQNIFKVDEASQALKFHCSYKYPFIHGDEEVRDKWISKSLHLDEINLSSQTVEPYYFDFPSEKKICETQLTLRIRAANREALARQLQEQISQDNYHITSAISEIRNYKERDYNCYKLLNLFNDWSSKRLTLLNERLSLKTKLAKNEPALNHYIRIYKSNQDGMHMSFVEFLVLEKKIELDVNGKNEDGKGCLQLLYENPYLRKKLYKVVPAIFTRGYRLTDYDLEYFKASRFIEEGEHILLELNYYNSLSDISMAPLVMKYLSYLLFIESVLQKRIIGSNLKSWIQYIVNFQGRYKEFWYFSKLALMKNGVWDLALATDKKGTLNRKIAEFNLEGRAPDEEMRRLLNQLYPEIFY